MTNNIGSLLEAYIVFSKDFKLKMKKLYWKRQWQNPLLCGYIFEYHCCKAMSRCDCTLLHCDINDYSKSVKINNILFMISSWKVMNKVKFQQKNSSKYDAVIRAINMICWCYVVTFQFLSILKMNIVLFYSSIKNNLLILIIEKKTKILLALRPILHRPTIYMENVTLWRLINQ